MKWNYPPEYLKKDGTLKKNCLKKAVQWRKESPPKFLPETTFNEQITSRLTTNDELLETIPYPSYQHMNQDIIDIFAKILIGDISNNGMNSIEECEMFRGFCIMNKRLCFLDKEFRKKYNIKEKIDKCKLIYETEKISKKFKISPTNGWLPFNKPMKYNYDQNYMELFKFFESKYSTYFNYNNSFYDIQKYRYKKINIHPLIETVQDFNGKILKENIKLCTDTELSGYNIFYDTDEVNSQDGRVKNPYENIFIYRFIDLIKVFKQYPLLYDDFILNLRRNYCKNSGYFSTEEIEFNIRYFIEILLN